MDSCWLPDVCFVTDVTVVLLKVWGGKKRKKREHSLASMRKLYLEINCICIPVLLNIQSADFFQY